MRKDFPTREELMAKSIVVLEHQNIMDADEEALVQSVLNEKRRVLPLPDNYLQTPREVLAMNITTKEQEEAAQKIIDEQRAKMRERVQKTIPTEEGLKQNLADLQAQKAELEKPVQRFCEFCDSKGVRHKLNCTRPR